jgi:predicted GIY-YIG superfamily endonuclease
LTDTPQTFWVYILQNSSGRFYIGSTDDVDRRVREHNDASFGEKTFTHKNGPWSVVWTESHPSRSAAMARERQIKGMKSAQWIRQHLLNGRVPTCRD